MFEKITSDNVLLFALKHYDNPQCEGEKEFYDDMKRFKYIKRLLKKYSQDGIVKERLLLNHIIVLNNVRVHVVWILAPFTLQDRSNVVLKLEQNM